MAEGVIASGSITGKTRTSGLSELPALRHSMKMLTQRKAKRWGLTLRYPACRRASTQRNPRHRPRSGYRFGCCRCALLNAALARIS